MFSRFFVRHRGGVIVLKQFGSEVDQGSIMVGVHALVHAPPLVWRCQLVEDVKGAVGLHGLEWLPVGCEDGEPRIAEAVGQIMGGTVPAFRVVPCG